MNQYYYIFIIGYKFMIKMKNWLAKYWNKYLKIEEKYQKEEKLKMIIFNIKKKQFDDAQQEYINPFYDKKLIKKKYLLFL